MRHLFFPCHHIHAIPREVQRILPHLSNRPPSIPGTSIGSMTRLADPTIPSSLREGPPVPSSPWTRSPHLRSRRCALPPVCRADHPLFRFTLQYIVTGPSLMPRPNSVSTVAHNRFPRRAASSEEQSTYSDPQRMLTILLRF